MILSVYRKSTNDKRITGNVSAPDGWSNTDEGDYGIVKVNLDLIRSTISIKTCDGALIEIEPIWIEAYFNDSGYAPLTNPCHCFYGQYGLAPHRQDLYFHTNGDGVDLVLADGAFYYSILFKIAKLSFTDKPENNGKNAKTYKQKAFRRMLDWYLRGRLIKEIDISEPDEAKEVFIAKRVFSQKFRKRLKSSPEIHYLYTAGRYQDSLKGKFDEVSGKKLVIKKYLNLSQGLYQQFKTDEPPSLVLELPDKD